MIRIWKGKLTSASRLKGCGLDVSHSVGFLSSTKSFGVSTTVSTFLK